MLTYPNLCANLCEYRQVAQPNPCIHIEPSELLNRFRILNRPKMRPLGPVCWRHLVAGFRGLNQEVSFLAFLFLNPNVTLNAPEPLLNLATRERKPSI